MLAIADLMQQCAPEVSPVLMHALVRTESAWRPFAIGMDSRHGAVKQPETLEEAVATAKSLAASGRKFSVGLAQIHMSNVALYGLTWEQAFNPCTNLSVGQKVLWNFFHRASANGYKGVAAVWAALRGYNSGGVDRSISDDYANKIFAYMSTTPPSVQLAQLSTKAATAAPRTPTVSAGLPSAATPLQLAAPEPQPKTKTRPGESLELFEKDEDQGGF